MSQILRAIPEPPLAISLDEPIADDVTLADALLCRFPSPFEVLAEKETQAMVQGILEVLPERERTILEFYYGIADGEEMTLQEIGEILGLTRERIRQIRDKALNMLRTCL